MPYTPLQYVLCSVVVRVEFVMAVLTVEPAPHSKTLRVAMVAYLRCVSLRYSHDRNAEPRRLVFQELVQLPVWEASQLSAKGPPQPPLLRYPLQVPDDYRRILFGSPVHNPS